MAPKYFKPLFRAMMVDVMLHRSALVFIVLFPCLEFVFLAALRRYPKSKCNWKIASMRSSLAPVLPAYASFDIFSSCGLNST